MTQSSGSDRSSMPLYRKRGSQVSLSNCSEMFCFLKDYGVLVCKQHRTGIVNLDEHFSQNHSVPDSTRKQVVDCLKRLKLVDPAKIKLPEEPERPLTGLQCKDCGFVTINENQIHMHCREYHCLHWKSDKALLYNPIKCRALSA